MNFAEIVYLTLAYLVAWPREKLVGRCVATSMYMVVFIHRACVGQLQNEHKNTQTQILQHDTIFFLLDID